MDDNIWKYSLRVDRTLFFKLKYIAEYNGRSVNKEIEQCLKQRIKNFENKYGEIPLDDK